jgi:N12 class adenine-specific DNA methylase
MYGAETVSVVADDLTILTTVDGHLAVALSDIVERARAAGQGFTEVSAEDVLERAQAVQSATDLWDGTIVAEGAEFRVAHNGSLEPLAVPKTQHVELRHLLRLRDGARALLEAEAGDAEDTAELGQQRPALRGDYEAYVAKYGPLNRYTLRRTGREETVTDPMTGEPVLDPATGRPEVVETLARLRPRPLVTFRHDPHTSLVRALERFDEDSQTSSPASLLAKRVVVPRPVKRGAETPSEAVALSLDETGRVDLAMIARLLGVDEAEARTRLGDLVYDDPVTGSLVHAPEYLSGDVRTKLDAATEAAALDERYAVNVEALREVLPDAYPRQFPAELLDDPTVQVENPVPGEWEVRGRRWGIRATNDWGADRRPATDIARAGMTGGACRRSGCPGWADIEDRGVRGPRTSAAVVPDAGDV